MDVPVKLSNEIVNTEDAGLGEMEQTAWFDFGSSIPTVSQAFILGFIQKPEIFSLPHNCINQNDLHQKRIQV